MNKKQEGLTQMMEHILKLYQFASFSENEFLFMVNQVKKELEKNAEMYDLLTFKKKLITVIHQQIRKYLLEKDKKGLEIINRYISFKIGFYQDPQKNIESLEKLNQFLLMIHYIPDDEDCQILIQKNKKLSLIIQSVIDLHSSKIEKYPLEQIYDKEIIFGFLFHYCQLNQINTIAYVLSDEKDRKEKACYVSDSTGFYLDEIRSESLTKKETRELYLKIQNCDAQARMTLVERNLRLVVRWAKNYVGCGLPFLDLIQEGNLALLKASLSFDIYRGCQFSTYATYWIRQAMERALDNHARIIRLPVPVMEKVKKLHKIEETLYMKSGKTPTIIELAHELHVSVEDITLWNRAQEHPVSLELPVGSYQKTSLGSLIKDPTEINFIEKYEQEEMKHIIMKSIDTLPEQDREVLLLHYGLKDGNALIFREIASRLHVSHQRINQVKQAGLCRLAYLPEIRTLAQEHGYNTENIEEKWDLKKKKRR